MINKYNNYHEK